MSTIFLDTFGSRISQAIKTPAKLSKVMVEIQLFFDKNHDIIFDSNPGRKLIFAESNKQSIYDFTGIAPEEISNCVEVKVKKAVKEYGYTNQRGEAFVLINDPFIIQMFFCIRELLLIKKEKEAELFIMFMCMKFYSSRQKSSFPYEPNPNIMAFTVNNLSNKFKYKQLQTNYNVIKDTAMISHDTYRAGLLKGTEQDFLTYIPQMENRIGKIIKAIAEEFYENLEKKNYLNTNKSFDDEDNVVDSESLSATVQHLSEGVVHDFMANKINMGIVRAVSARNNLPFTTVYQTLTEIKIKESPDVIIKLYGHVFNILTEYDKHIFDNVCSKGFALSALKQLSISNSNDPDLIALKAILDGLLNNHCSKYATTNRLPTKMAYRTTLYAYFIYLIILHRCR